MPDTAVLLVQLGSPEAPTPEALAPYLLEFLSDRHVIRRHPCVWQPLLRGLIIPRRKRISAANYARIWHPEHGSPLVHWTRRQAEALGSRMHVPVACAMRYGRPSIADVSQELASRGVRKLVALPLFPQHSDTTNGSILEVVRGAFAGEILEIPSFPDDPGYLSAVCSRIDETLATIPAPERILVSFHGIPQSYADAGEPYEAECARTFAGLVGRYSAHRLERVFQSRFGPVAWLRPYLVDRVRALAEEGVRRILVVQPGFVADCLETLDEVDREVRHAFLAAGGERMDRVPCLNDHPRWIEALEGLVRQRLGVTGPASPSP